MTTRKAVAIRSNAPRKAIRINKEAFKLVDENAGEIAKALLRAIKDGHVMSAQLLFQLADAGVDIADALDKRPLNTIAMRLGAERQLPRNYSDVKKEKDSPRTEILTV